MSLAPAAPFKTATHTASRRSALRPWLWLLAAVPLYLTWTFDHSLWNPDETRDAGIAAEMHRTGEYAVPHLNGDAFLEKPPLYYWACDAVYRLTGRVTAGTTRLPSALFGLLGIAFTFLIGRRLFGERAGLLAAGILAGAGQYFRMSHFAMMDVSLAAITTGALYFYLRGSKVGFALFAILAFYAKGFLGVGLPGLVVTVDLLSQKKIKTWIATVAVGAVLFALLAGPWFWALWKAGGRTFLRIFIVDNHLHRFASSVGDHTNHSIFFYFGSFVGDFMPWTPIAIAMIASFVAARRTLWADRSWRWCAIWFATLFVLFSISSSKRSIYLLPAFPAAALLCGAWLDRETQNGFQNRASRAAVWTTAVFVVVAAGATVAGGVALKGVVWIVIPAGLLLAAFCAAVIVFLRRGLWWSATGALPFLVGSTLALASPAFVRHLDRDKTFVPLCNEIRDRSAGREVIGYDLSEMQRGVFSFYLGRSFPNVADLNDLSARLARTPGEKWILVASRNKLAALAPLSASADVVYRYRPDDKARSYLVYESR